MTTMKKIKRTEAEVSRRVRIARTKRRMSQSKLAEMAGVDRKTINRIENGHFSPNVETLVRLCDALNVKIAAFMRGL